MVFLKKIEKLRAEIEGALSSAVSQSAVKPAMDYSLLAGGKRIRPILTLACCEAAGGERGVAMPLAIAVEMVHTYSLIHDDLPAMDDDDLRRGRPSSHKAFGEASAILAGDALLTLAFEVISRADLPPRPALAAVRRLAVAAGGEGMVGGQALDIRDEQGEPGSDELLFTYSLKTGALIRAAAALGAIAAGADENMFEGFATPLAAAFQIQDDILDISGDGASLGKNTGSDARRAKLTYAAAAGAGPAREMVLRLTEEAVSAISHLGARGEFLTNLAIMLSGREG